jgi:hypothetical protein
MPLRLFYIIITVSSYILGMKHTFYVENESELYCILLQYFYIKGSERWPSNIYERY